MNDRDPILNEIDRSVSAINRHTREIADIDRRLGLSGRVAQAERITEGRALDRLMADVAEQPERFDESTGGFNLDHEPDHPCSKCGHEMEYAKADEDGEPPRVRHIPAHWACTRCDHTEKD